LTRTTTLSASGHGREGARRYESLVTGVAAFPDVPLLTEDYVTAANFFNLCRSKGIQGANASSEMGGCSKQPKENCVARGNSLLIVSLSCG
jgi:hypothetical protein